MKNFTDSENTKYIKLLEMVNKYESITNNLEKEQYFKSIITDYPDITIDYLDNYWRSVDLEHFCTQYCLDKIDSLSDINSRNVIEEILNNKNCDEFLDKSIYLALKYSEFFEIKYGCPNGVFYNVVFENKVLTYDDVINVLNNNGPIYI